MSWPLCEKSNIYLSFNINHWQYLPVYSQQKNARKGYEICLELTKKTSERGQWCFSVFMVNTFHTYFVVLLLLTWACIFFPEMRPLNAKFHNNINYIYFLKVYFYISRVILIFTNLTPRCCLKHIANVAEFQSYCRLQQ